MLSKDKKMKTLGTVRVESKKKQKKEGFCFLLANNKIVEKDYILFLQIFVS